MHPAIKCFVWLLLPVILRYFFQFNILNVVLASIAPAVVFFGRGKSKFNLPPGPLGLPIIGSLPWLMKDSNKYLQQCHKKYGDIITIKMGAVTNVIINDYNLIKEFSNLAQAQNRPSQAILFKLAGGKGIVNSNGIVWKHQRRFFLNCLRDSGMGKLRMEDKIRSAINKMVKHIEKQDGRPTSLQEIIFQVVFSVICNLAFNKQLEFDDPEFLELNRLINGTVSQVGELSAVTFFPWLEPFFRGKFKKSKLGVEQIIGTCKGFIEEHKKNLDPNNPQDFMDLYLLEMKKDATEETKEFLDTFSEEELTYTTLNLFIAGTSTTAHTILWALAFMVLHPDIQKKVQAEIDDVLGVDGIVSVLNKHELPYTSATLQECERLVTIIPRALPRSTTDTINFHGYCIPPNTMVNFNLHAVHMSDSLWQDVNTFNPSRFIQSDGTVNRPQQLIPFGSGRRSCPGEALAKSELFLIFTTLLKKFSFEEPNDSPLEIKSNVGLSNFIDDYKIVARPRQAKI